MGWNWHNYEHEYKRRKPNAEFKRMWKDIELTKDNEGTFHLHLSEFRWERKNAGYVREKVQSSKLASITSDNVLTLLYEKRPNMTICNRLTTILGRNVWSDTSHHRNKEITVRIRTARWDKAKQEYVADSWHPSGVSTSNWAHGTIPYVTGMQFKMDSHTGEPIKLLSEVKDIRVLVKNEAIQQAKADTKVIRTLVKAMARLGSFDEQINARLGGAWAFPFDSYKKLEHVNYKEPQGDDAGSVFAHGLYNSTMPNHSQWLSGVWTKVPFEDRRRQIIDKAIDNGLKGLRKHIYSTTEGYERVAS